MPIKFIRQLADFVLTYGRWYTIAVKVTMGVAESNGGPLLGAGWLPSTWISCCYSQVNSALHPSGVAKSSTSFSWGKGGKVTSAGWQVTLCDLIWHVISRSGVAISITNCYIRFTYLLTYTYDISTYSVQQWSCELGLGLDYVLLVCTLTVHSRNM